MVALSMLCLPWGAQAQVVGRDPRAPDLRVGVFPLAFQGGIVRHHFGSALRLEYDVHRRVTVGAWGRIGWLHLGDVQRPAHAVAGLVHVHIVERVQRQRLAGTVYPANASDVPALGTGIGTGGESRMSLNGSQLLGGPRLTLPERDENAEAPLRTTHSARLGYSYLRLVQRREVSADETRSIDAEYAYMDSQLHAPSVGYAYTSHWNLANEGEREVGFRRFYGDVLFAPARWTTSTALAASADLPVRNRGTLGARVGMEGTSGSVWKATGLALAYTLEIDVYTGRGYLEGFLFLGLGLAWEAAT